MRCVPHIYSTPIRNSKKNLFFVNNFFSFNEIYSTCMYVCARTRLCVERKRERARTTCSTPLTNIPTKAHMSTCMYVYISMSHVPCINETCATYILNSNTQFKKKSVFGQQFFVHMCTYMYVYMYICVHISVCVRGRVHVLARACVCVCVCVCV